MSKTSNKIAPGLTEKCAVFGVYGKGLEAARLVHTGLWALQHRGQDGSGIVSSAGRSLYAVRDSGLVAHVYDEVNMSRLRGHIAIGHNRYATSGASNAHVQPVVQPGSLLALAHNGNLPLLTKLRHFLKGRHLDTRQLNDSELMHLAIRIHLQDGLNLEQAIKNSFPLFTGAFSLLIMTNTKLAAMRDRFGIRPLSIGQLGDGQYVVSSETCALDAVGATFVRDVRPGELVIIDQDGLHSYQLAKGETRLDIFEFIYFARPDSVLLGKNVNQVRQEFGRQLAREHQLSADVVIPIPDSGIPAALGYARQSGIPFDHGFVKNRYIHRTFIRPAQSLRERDVEIKLNALPNTLKDKRVIVIDDSIVRGTTSKKIVAMVRAAGAKAVHVLASSPPVRYPDYYGINTPSSSELVAAHCTQEQICDLIGADTVGFLSLPGMIAANGLPENSLNTSCFTGIYPLPTGRKIVKPKYS